MRKTLSGILTTIQVTRLALVLTAVSNIWLIACLSDALPAATTRESSFPLWQMLLLTAGVAMGLYVFGMTINDVLDARRDRAFAPSRPIPSGRISASGTAVIGIAGLLTAGACATPLGPISTLFALGCAALILTYNAATKFIPALGLLTLGLIRGTHMLIADPRFEYAWPVWLTVSHVILISAVAYHLEGKRPRLQARTIVFLAVGYLFFCLILVGWSLMRGGLTIPALPWIWVGPLAAGLVFLAFAGYRASRCETPKMAGGMLVKIGLIWLIIYDAAWLAAAGLWWQAGMIGSLVVLTLAAVQGTRVLAAAVARPTFARQSVPDDSGELSDG